MQFHFKYLLLLLTIVCTKAGEAQVRNSNDIAVMAYYAGRATALDSFEANKLTHIIYCFGHLEGNRFHLKNLNDTNLIQQMVALKNKNPNLKVTLSLGGWGGCASCSDVFATKKGRRQFTRSVKRDLRFFSADGIDLDWEYPTIAGFPGHKYAAADKEHFTLLINQLRKKLGKAAIISFAAGGFPQYLKEAVDWKQIIGKVDYINLMTYDLVSGYAKQTGHHTALFSTQQQTGSTDYAVQYLIKQDVPRSKLIIGAAFYARIWEHVADTNHGLYQAGIFKASESFKDFSTRISPDSGYVYYWDSTAQAPYAYNATQQLFATFDDAHSISVKTQYVIDHQLGGIMFWQLAEDTYTDGLLEAIDRTKKNYIKSPR